MRSWSQMCGRINPIPFFVLRNSAAFFKMLLSGPGNPYSCLFQWPSSKQRVRLSEPRLILLWNQCDLGDGPAHLGNGFFGDIPSVVKQSDVRCERGDAPR